jgi:pSer/pThr/pTyr-binding forkhead associated (FHA) protein
MLKLVLLSPGMTGRTQELKQEKTTIGRLEDNTFQVAEPSVSSHHCEVLLRGSEVVIWDLDSTNGT